MRLLDNDDDDTKKKKKKCEDLFEVVNI